jgi:hypothetical protein
MLASGQASLAIIWRRILSRISDSMSGGIIRGDLITLENLLRL